MFHFTSFYITRHEPSEVLAYFISQPLVSVSLILRCLPSTVSELQAEEEHRLLYFADVHAINPNYHPLLGVLLDKL